ncbi:MAG: nucleotidyltransferase substrate binding protein [Phaeodactylibacter sp.]|nr:nucleotidyltransferase substrate binding protein [Phaeodactylibacter sp.]
MLGSRDATREAFAAGLIKEGEKWMEMIKSRNLTSHTYNEDTANEIFAKIIADFLPCFLDLADHIRRVGKVFYTGERVVLSGAKPAMPVYTDPAGFVVDKTCRASVYQREALLIEIMKEDEGSGLYDT